MSRVLKALDRVLFGAIGLLLAAMLGPAVAVLRAETTDGAGRVLCGTHPHLL